MNSKIVFLFAFGIAAALSAAPVSLTVLTKKNNQIRNFTVSKWGAACNFSAQLKENTVYRFSFDIKKLDEELNVIDCIIQGDAKQHSQKIVVTSKFNRASVLFRTTRDAKYQIVLNDPKGKKADFEIQNPVLNDLGEEDLQKGVLLTNSENPDAGAGWLRIKNIETAESDLPGSSKCLVLCSQGSCERELVFRAGHRYKLEFWAKTDVSGQIVLQVHRWGKPDYLKINRFSVNKDWKKYSVEYDFSDKQLKKIPCLKAGIVNMILGQKKNPSKILIDRVQWLEIK